jgi:sulfur carrier protein ThiS adenylyltransferase
MTFNEIRDQLKNKSVAIAGCGGLGSNCAIALARTGIGKLILVDFDKVEEINLNRQYFFHHQIGQPKVYALKDNIQKIDPGVEVEAHEAMLDPDSVCSLFINCDIIIEAFDESHAKQMIIETVLAEMPEKYILSGQGLAGYGKNDDISTMSMGKLFIIGDGRTEVSNEQPPLAPRVAIVANMQANLALELLLNEE